MDFPTLGYCSCKRSKQSITAASLRLCISFWNHKNEHCIVLGKQGIGGCLSRSCCASCAHSRLWQLWLEWHNDCVTWECLTWWHLQRDKGWHHFLVSVGDILAVIWSIWWLQTISCSVCSANPEISPFPGWKPWMLFVFCDAVFGSLDKRCACLLLDLFPHSQREQCIALQFVLLSLCCVLQLLMNFQLTAGWKNVEEIALTQNALFHSARIKCTIRKHCNFVSLFR